MARKAKPKEDPEEPHRIRDTVSQVAHALRHRDEVVHTALGFLFDAGFVDAATRERLLATYEAGDTATRLAIQEMLAHALRVPLDRLDDRLDAGQVDPARVSTRSIEDLQQMTLPQVDVDAVAERIRGIDMEGLVERSLKDNRVVRAVTNLPVHLNRLRIGMLLGGILLLLVVAVALLFPQYALWIAFYGLLAALGILGGLLVTWAIRLERGAKELGIDLVVFARLDPEERRLLLARRLWLGIVDTRRLGDLVEKSLHAMLPERMQAPPRGPVGPPQQAKPRRPLPIDHETDDAQEEEPLR